MRPATALSRLVTRSCTGPAWRSVTAGRAAACSSSSSDGQARAKWTPESKRTGVMAMKVGMVPLWDEWGVRHPCTVLMLDNTQVVQSKTQESNGYTALQVGVGEAKQKNVSKPLAGHFEKAGVTPNRKLEEFKVTPDALLDAGTRLDARHFIPGQLVDVAGVSIGKGFQGAMKRHNFGGQPASHGNSKTHRHMGSTGFGATNPARVHKGKKMPGRMGNKRSYMQALSVRRIEVDHSSGRNLLYVRGAVPGKPGSFCRVSDARLMKFDEASPPPFPTFLPGDGPEQEVLHAPKTPVDPFL